MILMQKCCDEKNVDMSMLNIFLTALKIYKWQQVYKKNKDSIN